MKRLKFSKSLHSCSLFGERGTIRSCGANVMKLPMETKDIHPGTNGEKYNLTRDKRMEKYKQTTCISARRATEMNSRENHKDNSSN
jgi:hypothetical protein